MKLPTTIFLNCVHHTQEIFDEIEQNKGFVKNYNDVFCGQAYLEAVQKGSIGLDDVLMFSIDSAQLFERKESDCWIYIWIILDLSPDHCYKKQFVLPGTIIPGPKKPTFVESFLYPGLHHLSALQWKGLHVWDAAQDHVFDSQLYFFLGCGDGPGLTTLSNCVGHSGKCGCCMLCSLTGWRKPGSSQYYPVLLKPDNYNVPGSNHADVNSEDIRTSTSADYVEHLRYVLESNSQAQFQSCHLETGIVGLSVLLRL